MKRILITGSAGLVGRVLVSEMRARHVDVVRMDLRLDHPSDIRDRKAVAAAMSVDGGEIDGVIHLAAISRVAWGEQAPELTEDINIAGTRVLIEEAQKQRRPPWFLFASSREVYGNPQSFPVRETFPIAPVNCYGRSKAAGEELVEAARGSGMRVGIVRLSNVYGTEHDHPDRALPALLWRAMQGLEIRITGADNFFDFVHVDDSVRGIRLMAQQLDAGEAQLPPIHLATGVRTRLGDLAELALSISGSASNVTVLPPRPFDVGGFCGDPARARQILGWEPQTDIRSGMLSLRQRFLGLGHGPYSVEMPRR